jgi:hypothetical protein
LIRRSSISATITLIWSASLTTRGEPMAYAPPLRPLSESS